MNLMPVTDSMFLVGESREQPMHVGGLQLFETPEGAGPNYLREVYEQSLRVEEIAPLFRKRAYRSMGTFGQWAWTEDRDVDLEHHVRHSALPRPGRVRELLALTSRLHGTLLDRQRPLWEGHLIEGLEDGRYAVYTKLHHSMMDGVSALRLLQESLSTDADERDRPPPWAPQPGRRKRANSGLDLLGLPKAAVRTAVDVAGLGRAVARFAEREIGERGVLAGVRAPRSIFNVSITGSRRFAAQSWALDDLRALGKAADATVNDVVLALCAGALRRYLQDLNELPGDPLIAMTPVSLRAADDEREGGNAVGSILCNLATDVADPVARLEAVRDSMRSGKDALKGLTPLQVTAVSAVVMAPLMASTFGLHNVARPPFNLIISNIPGPPKPLYWNGARLDGIYPLSIPLNGQALNITVTSNADQLHFGLTGCRRTVPHLQRLLGHIDQELSTLNRALGI